MEVTTAGRALICPPCLDKEMVRFMLLHLSPERRAFRKPWLCGVMMLWLTVGFRANASVPYNSAGNSLISVTCTGGNASFNSLTVNKLKSIWTGLSN